VAREDSLHLVFDPLHVPQHHVDADRRGAREPFVSVFPILVTYFDCSTVARRDALTFVERKIAGSVNVEVYVRMGVGP
jgi:hypothetical protein